MELMTSEQVCVTLGIKQNHLHQLQHRKQLAWTEKKGKRVYYSSDDVETLKVKRTK